MADEPELVKYQSGEWVQYLQQLLANAGYWSQDADGEFGDDLEQAVMQLQSAYGLSGDGVVRADTWGVLTGEGGQSSEDGGQSSEDPDERQVLINGEDIPELLFLVSFDSWEDWATAIGLDLDWLQTDDELIS